jgi:hypothetical protein
MNPTDLMKKNLEEKMGPFTGTKCGTSTSKQIPL